MSTTDVAAIVPAIREAAETDAIWFLGTLSMIKASRESTDGHMAVVEMLAPRASARRCTCTAAKTNGSTSSRVR